MALVLLIEVARAGLMLYLLLLGLLQDLIERFEDLRLDECLLGLVVDDLLVKLRLRLGCRLRLPFQLGQVFRECSVGTWKAPLRVVVHV